jgi:hypothetical protein
MDNLNIHSHTSLTDCFGERKSGEIWDRLTVHYTPNTEAGSIKRKSNSACTHGNAWANARIFNLCVSSYDKQSANWPTASPRRRLGNRFPCTHSAVIESMRPMDMPPVSFSRPALAISRLGFTSAPPRWNPPLATAAGKQLARIYGGDLASTDWRHLGRLAGFTNQKPERRIPGGYAPWVKIVYTRVGLARNADGLLQSVIQLPVLTQGR